MKAALLIALGVLALAVACNASKCEAEHGRCADINLYVCEDATTHERKAFSSGRCPGKSSIRCCLKGELKSKCVAKGFVCGNSKTKDCKGGTWASGLCGGDNDMQCCEHGEVVSKPQTSTPDSTPAPTTTDTTSLPTNSMTKEDAERVVEHGGIDEHPADGAHTTKPVVQTGHEETVEEVDQSLLSDNNAPAEKTVIINKEGQATWRKQTPPTAAALIAAYPQGASTIMHQKLGINAKWLGENTCTLRLGEALLGAGVKIPKIYETKKDGKRDLNVVKATKGWIIYRVRILKPFLTGTFGQPKYTLKKNAKQEVKDLDQTALMNRAVRIYFDMKQHKGIIAWDIDFPDATGHVDLWNGHSMVEQEHSPDHVTLQYILRANAIYIWDMP